jgi:hypothetical protein
MQKKLMPKHELPTSIPLHDQGLNCKANVYELKDHVRAKGMEFELADKV